jgi:hypothetical protein
MFIRLLFNFIFLFFLFLNNLFSSKSAKNISSSTKSTAKKLQTTSLAAQFTNEIVSSMTDDGSLSQSDSMMIGIMATTFINQQIKDSTPLGNSISAAVNSIIDMTDDVDERKLLVKILAKKMGPQIKTAFKSTKEINPEEEENEKQIKKGKK